MLATLPSSLPNLARHVISWLAPRRIPAGMIALGGIVLLGIIAASTRSAAQAPLFGSPLVPSQAIEVERALTVWNEPFTVDGQHSQVFVPASRRRDVLLRLTLAGLPHRFVPTSSDVLAQADSPFMSQSALSDRRRAGIEGDLVTGLRRIDGVVDAAVVIAPALDDPLSPFESRSPPSASVQLVMQSGAQLSPSAVSGIKRFVSASYPGLSPDRVVVVDGTGSTVGNQTAIDRVTSREVRLQNAIQSALDAVFGPSAAIVRVSLRSQGEERTAQSTRINPHGELESDAGREHGTDSGKHFDRTRERKRLAYDTITETSSSHADVVAHVSVAVFLDARRVSLDQSKLVADLVRASAGADLQGGDTVVVQALPFQSITASPSVVTSGHHLRLSVSKILACVLMIIGTGLAFAPQLFKRPRPEAVAASFIHAQLEHELPQTAAYVLRAMPARVREHVLREYPLEQRERIKVHLNGHGRG